MRWDKRWCSGNTGCHSVRSGMVDTVEGIVVENRLTMCGYSFGKYDTLDAVQDNRVGSTQGTPVVSAVVEPRQEVVVKVLPEKVQQLQLPLMSKVSHGTERQVENTMERCVRELQQANTENRHYILRQVLQSLQNIL